jgi:hypothetical protein
MYGNIRDYFEGMENGEIRELPEDVWRGGRRATGVLSGAKSGP